MPILTFKDELVSLNRFFSHGLWKLFGNFDYDFPKCLTKGFFVTGYEEFWNSVLSGILDNRQPLLINSNPAIYNIDYI